MKTKSFYSKPTVKIVKIDCVYLAGASKSDYPLEEGTGQEEGGNEQGGSEVPGT